MYNVVVDPREPVGRREDHHPLDDVAKLANIAGPVVRLERGHRLGADLGRRHATFGGVAADEMIAQRCDIVAPLAQRRDMNRYDVQPVKEILGKRWEEQTYELQ